MEDVYSFIEILSSHTLTEEGMVSRNGGERRGRKEKSESVRKGVICTNEWERRKIGGRKGCLACSVDGVTQGQVMEL